MPKKLPILLVYLLEPGRSVGSHILQTEAEIEWFADQAWVFGVIWGLPKIGTPKAIAFDWTRLIFDLDGILPFKEPPFDSKLKAACFPFDQAVHSFTKWKGVRHKEARLLVEGAGPGMCAGSCLGRDAAGSWSLLIWRTFCFPTSWRRNSMQPWPPVLDSRPNMGRSLYCLSLGFPFFSLSEHMLSSVECNKVLTLFLNGVAPYVIRGLAQHWTTRLPLIIDGFHDPLAKAATSSSIKWRRFGPKRDHCLWHFMDVCGTLLILERSWTKIASWFIYVHLLPMFFLKCVSYTRPPWQLGSHFLLLFLHEEQAEASQDKDQTDSTESEPGKKAEDTEVQPCFRSTFGSHWQQLIDIWSLGQGWGVCDLQPCSFFTLNGDLMSKSWQQQVSHILY